MKAQKHAERLDQELQQRLANGAAIETTKGHPEFLKEYMPVMYYSLEAHSDGGGTEENIELTQDEYRKLRVYIARVRGYAIEEAA